MNLQCGILLQNKKRYDSELPYQRPDLTEVMEPVPLTLKLRDSTVYISYIYQSSVHFQFLLNMAGFPVILNNFRHNRVFGTGKTPNSGTQHHCVKCFTSYKLISKQKVLLEKHKTGVQTGIRVENRGPTFC